MKTFIIVSQDDEHSVMKSNECIKQANKYNIYPEVFNAIKGENAQEIFDKFNTTKVLKSACAIDKLKKNGVKGCLASHLVLLDKCMNENVPYLIMEHDAYFIRHLPEDILDKFKTTLHLDSYDHLADDYYDKIDKSINNKSENESEIMKYTETRPINEVKYRALTGREGIRYTYFYGAHAYIIKPQYIHKIFDYLRTFGLVPADWLFNTFIFPTLSCIRKPIVCVHRKYNSKYVRENDLSLTNK